MRTAFLQDKEQLQIVQIPRPVCPRGPGTRGKGLWFVRGRHPLVQERCRL